MNISMYHASAPVFVRMLNNLGGILDKAAAHAAAKKIDPAVLLQTRLYPDMFALTRQVQVAADFAKGCVARLAGVDVPKYEDNEAGFADLKARIDKTVIFINTLTAAQIDGSADKEITLTLGGQEMKFSGLDYLLNLVLPNFYFHVTTAYAILRHNGVEVGKRDFVGGM